MNKREFLEALAAQLASLTEEDREQSLAFYAEMIDDCVENGASEEEVIALLDPVEVIAGEILLNAPVRKRSRRRLRGWEIALLIIGSPVWLPLLLAAAIVSLALLIILWSLIAALWAMAAGFVVSAPASIIAAGLALFRWNLLRSTVCVGTGLVTAGLAILLLLAARRATDGARRLTRFCWTRMRRA